MKILNFLKNKYLLTVIALVVWLFYFDKNDVFTQFELIDKCNKLKAERDYYIAEILHNKKEIEDLENNTKSLETLAREKYLMKKDNEEVFVFVTK